MVRSTSAMVDRFLCRQVSRSLSYSRARKPPQEFMREHRKRIVAAARTSAIWPRWRSSGLATVVATSAPSRIKPLVTQAAWRKPDVYSGARYSRPMLVAREAKIREAS